MKFEIKHIFKQDPKTVAAAMFHPEIGPHLTERMETIIAIEGLEREENGGKLSSRTRYLPVPLIKRVGLKKVEPRWMEWISELTFDLDKLEGTFRNIPSTKKLEDTLVNGGRLTMTQTADGGTERILAGELKVKIPLVGRVAEKIIFSNAQKILDDEARATQALLDEGVLSQIAD